MVLGRTVTTEEARDIARYSKTAGGTYSDRFINTTMPSLMQEMGGSQAGNSLFMLSKHLRGGMANKHIAVQTADKLGLLEERNKIVRTKTGEIKGYTGKIKGDALLASDPDRWVWEDVKPALENAGFKSPEDKMRILQQLLPGTAANVVAKLLQQEATFKTHAERYEKTPSLDQMAENQKADPTVAAKSLSSAFDNLASAALKAQPVADSLNALADAMNAQAEKIITAGDKWDLLREQSPLAKATRAAEEAAKAEGRKVTPGDQARAFWKTIRESWSTPKASEITKARAPSFTQLHGGGFEGFDATPIDFRKAKRAPLQHAPEAMTTLAKIESTPAMPAFVNQTQEAKQALESLNLTVRPNVDQSSLQGTLGLLQQINSEIAKANGGLAGVKANASSAASATSNAAARIGSLKSLNMSSYSTAGDPAK